MTVIDRAGLNIEVDVVLTEKHGDPVEVTKHPVDGAFSPTDHARVLPERYQFEGVFTNTPLSATQRQARSVTEDRSSSTGRPGAVGYAQQQYAALLRLKTERRTVTVETELRTYQRMVLQNVDVSRDSKMGDAVRFTASFEEVRFVFSEVARAQVQFAPKRKPTTKVDQTKKQGDAATSQRTTLLKKFTNWTGLTDVGSGVAP